MRPFFRPHRRAQAVGKNAGARGETRWVDVFIGAASASGTEVADLGRRYTERQLMLLYRADQRRHARGLADLIGAVACGYGGVKTEKGSKAMQRVMAKLQE